MTFRVGVGGFITTSLMREYVGEILDSGRLTYGPFCQRFEEEFARMHDCRYGVLSNSGTSSLQVALQALKIQHGWQDGDEVIIPSVTFVATANVVFHNGMVPVPVDVTMLDYNIDTGLIAAAITERTKAIIPVHLFGQPAEMEKVSDLARRYDLRVIEDSCETVLARRNGIPVGSFGDVGCFSMYAAHHVAAGVGGISLTNDPALTDLMRSLVNHGRSNAYTRLEHSQGLINLSDRFKFNHIGHSFRITEFEAAIALAQLVDIEAQIERRRLIAFVYDSGLLNLPLLLPGVRISSTHSFMMYPILCEAGCNRDDLTRHLESKGIETRTMLPLISQPAYNGLWDEGDFPIAKHIKDNGFYIGCHPGISDDDARYVTDTIERYFL